MCRHVAYLGPPIPLAAVLFDPPHALVHQASAPRQMRHGGRINADGFGIGWFDAGQPLRYRRDRPLWADAQLPHLAARIRASAMLAAVRSATAGMPVTESACAPFTGEGWLFSHNGKILGWPDTVAALAERLPVTRLLSMEALTDSVLLWELVQARLRAGQPAPTAVAETVTEVARAAPGSRLNLLLTDSRTIVATTVTHSLWVRQHGGATLVSSEPLDDDPAWQPVADQRLVVATTDRVTVTRLPDPAG
ncbi:MAG TPA: ergothioneine biosynthesis protein EgtC [Natronosporangium sp.]|jgi:glutamine amidotransferase|nr:ergothioneine biosynthesis protein EgtC [Natronosporangium sp.]